MVATTLQQRRLTDMNFQIEKIGEEAAKLRAAHLEKLAPLEELIRKHSPLPASYDVSRMQPPYYFEFTYTEGLGGIYVCPQSSEMAARMMVYAAEDDGVWDFNVIDNLVKADKYVLSDSYSLVEDKPLEVMPKRVAFTPGHNIFDESVSAEVMKRLMFDDPELVIKPHPITNPELIRKLGRMFGYHRILDPKSSGLGLLKNLETAYVTASTELGFYAVLQGIDIENITNYHFEMRSGFMPLYRLLWKASRKDAKRILTHCLSSPFSGFFFPDDPQVEDKIKAYFDVAMQQRAAMKPLVQEYTPDQYANLIFPPRPVTRQVTKPVEKPADAK